MLNLVDAILYKLSENMIACLPKSFIDFNSIKTGKSPVCLADEPLGLGKIWLIRVG